MSTRDSTATAARVSGVIAVLTGLVLSYNLLVDEPARLGPTLVRGSAGVIGPYVLVLGVPGLVAGRSRRTVQVAGILCVVLAVTVGAIAIAQLAATPFVRNVVVGAAIMLVMVGGTMIAAARDPLRD